MIKYNQPSINDADIEAVNDVLRSGNLTQGNKVAEFEDAICHYCNCGYAVAFNSGTSALYAAYKVVPTQYHTNMITSPNTFRATSSAYDLSGFHNISSFSDIDIKTGNIDIDDMETDFQCHIFVPVHYAGNTVNMKQLKETWHSYIIEDACHALGSKYKCGSKVGNCKYSDMTVFSTHAIKTITTGEGGIVTTNNENYYKQLKLIRNHGINDDKQFIFPSFNFRMTEFQAALGISQLSRINEFVRQRKQIAHRYKKSPIIKRYFDLPEIDYRNSSHHLYPVLLKSGKVKNLQKYLLSKGIETQRHYKPLSNDCPNAKEWYDRELSLPIHCELSVTEQSYVIDEIRKYYDEQ